MVAEQYVVSTQPVDPGQRSASGPDMLLTLYDTPGQEDYPRVRPLAYSQAHVILMCFAIHDPVSLSNVEEKWIQEANFERPGLPIILVGCQSDRRVELSKKSTPISYAEGSAMAKKIGAQTYCECSSKTNEGVKWVFHNVAHFARQAESRASRGCILA